MYKIEQTAKLLIPALLVFAAFYLFFVGGGTFTFAFLDNEAWYRTGWVADDAVLTFPQKLLYFAVWISPVIFGLWSVYAAIKMLLLMRTGVLFDARIGRLLRHVGLGTSLSGLTDFCANLVDVSILTLANPNGAEGLRWYFDSEPAGLIMCGGGFYLIGWVLVEARRLADENEGFV